MPEGLTGDPADPAVLQAYARRFLQAAIANGIQVLGLTPHSTTVGQNGEISATWSIIDEWNVGTDDDAVPFRDKIFAVFPGFEPSFRQGRDGLHMLFLFDPEITRAKYLNAFQMMMGGVTPWRQGDLQLSSKTAEEAFEDLRTFHRQESQAEGSRQPSWNHLVLAPHVDSDKGLLNTQRAQVLQHFEHTAVSALELGDNKLPEDCLKNRPWLQESMQTLRQTFFHSSDAYTVDDVGKRFTWLKLASPRIESLRQAFIASDSRVRIAYVRGEDGEFQELHDSPDVTLSPRPWLKSVSTSGGSAFFGSPAGEGNAPTRFDLSPDLTCIIGGSMTGKSTLLDGLRVYSKAPLPDDKSVREQVESRGNNRFLLGSPEVRLDVPGSDPVADDHSRWPAQYFAQNELQRLAESGSTEELLGRLAVSEAQEIEDRRKTLNSLDRKLADAAATLAAEYAKLAEAEQDVHRSSRAKHELEAFKAAGVNELLALGRLRQVWTDAIDEGSRIKDEIDKVLASTMSLSFDQLVKDSPVASNADDPEPLNDGPSDSWARVVSHLKAARDELVTWKSSLERVKTRLKKLEARSRVEVERTLAQQDLAAGKLDEFALLNRQATLLASYEQQLRQKQDEIKAAECSFNRLQGERADQQQRQRKAFDRVLQQIDLQFGGRIRARRVDDGDPRPLDTFLRDLGQRGVSRWWNGLAPSNKPSPQALLRHLIQDDLEGVEMSSAVQETFHESLTRDKRRALAALRARDVYILEFRLEDGGYRPLDELSGGQRVSVLLSLLLEAADDRPLVIDQPEDELDNAFLWETVLPALKRLKGKRQVIVATHNPNIVVNGDADMVIQLEATATRGHVAVAGTIEDPEVRDAIVRTVDGGDEAFRLRRRKYGF